MKAGQENTSGTENVDFAIFQSQQQKYLWYQTILFWHFGN